METKMKQTINYKTILSRYGTILVLLFMMAAMTIISKNFLTRVNLFNIVRQISMYAILGFGVTFIIITGGIDLSTGAVVAVSSMVMGTLTVKNGMPWPIALIACLATGALIGLVNGFFVAFTKIPPFVATLGMMLSLRGVALMISDKPISGYEESFLFLGKGSLLGVPFLIYIMLGVGLLSYYLLRHTRFGRYIFAIGGNTEAANVSGINIKKALMTGYAYCSTLAALAGVLLCSRIMTSQPASGVGYELEAIAGAVIGGTSLSGGLGTIWGTLIGTLIIGVLNNALDLMQVNPYMQQVLKGAVIIGAVVLDTMRNKKR